MKMLSSLRPWFFLLSLALPLAMQAQVVTVDPVFPNVDDTITVTFNAAEGNGALAGFSPVYAHAGLITENSTSPTDWKYVQGNWGQADPKVLMTDIGNDQHQLTYHVRSYYGLPQGEKALELSFVFRTADGSTVGRDTDGSDIYYPLYEAGQLAAKILTPEDISLVEVGDTISIEAAASDTATMQLFANKTLLTQTTGRDLAYDLVTVSGSDYEVELVVDNGTSVVRDTIEIFPRPAVNVQDPPSLTEPGVNILDDSTVRVALLAPQKQYVYLLGDFNDWKPTSEAYMNRTQDGRLYWLDITGLDATTEYAYQFYIDGTLKVADPFATKILDPNNDQWIPATTYPNLKPYPNGKTSGIVSVLQIDKPEYQWQTTNYQRPAPEDLIIYELLVRDFTDARTFQAVIDSLNYLENLGINAIELMPIMEFEGNESWGYNPMHFFAVDKYYGTENDLKALIDSCHARGIAVILDMVLNHAFGQCPLVQMYWDGTKPTANSPWFNPDARHPFNVGFDFNHESDDTKYFSDRVLRYWVEEFRFDGYRMDLSKGITQTNNPNDVGAWSSYDASRIALLERMYNELKTVDPEVYFILEHFADNNEERELSDKGMFTWGNHNHNYNEGTMGYISGSNFSGISYQNRGWNNPLLIGYMESHDEERLMYKNLEFGNSSGSYNVKDLNTALARVEMAAAFLFTVPGPKMLWQFGEYGYDYAIDFNGRTGNKPVVWEYLENPNRLKLYKTFSAIINLRTDHEVFRTDNFNLDVGGGVKRIRLYDNSMNVVIIGNFEVTNQNGTPGFPATGWWYDYLSGDSVNVSDVNMQMPLAPGEFHIFTDERLTTPDVSLNTEELIAAYPLKLLAAPNPAIGRTEIQYTLDKSVEVQLQIMDMQGRILRQESLGRQLAGTQTWNWNLRDQAGQQLGAGIYFLRMQTGSDAETLRIVVQ